MSTQETPERPGQRRQLTIVSVAAAVLLAGGGGAYWASNASSSDDGASPARGGDGKPAPLVLDGMGQEESGGGDRGIAPGEPNPAGTVYRAKGKLPKGPESAPVHRPSGKIGKVDVAEIAEALDVPGRPRLESGNWLIGGDRDGSGPTLTVGDAQRAGSWSFNRYVPGGDGKCGTPPEGKSGTLPAPCPGGGAEASQSGEPVSEEEAEKAVEPVLGALDLRGAHLDASSVIGALRTVSVEPELGGLPAHDWVSTFTVGPDGTLVQGNGRLGGLVKGAEYPVMTAQETLDALNEHHGSAPAVPPCDLPAPAPDQAAGDDPESDVMRCANTAAKPGSTTVTGATFGLGTQYSQGSPVLVPSWIYDVRQQGDSGHGYQVTFPAVEPEFIASASKGDDTPTAQPPSDPGSQKQGLTSYAVEGRSLKLTFWGGVCHDYRATADATDAKVAVSVTPKNADPDKICVQMAEKQTATVELDEPLGDRKVVDARSGEALQRK